VDGCFLTLPTLLSTGEIFDASSGHDLNSANSSRSVASSSPSHQAHMPMFFSQTIGAAITARHRFLCVDFVSTRASECECVSKSAVPGCPKRPELRVLARTVTRRGSTEQERKSGPRENIQPLAPLRESRGSYLKSQNRPPEPAHPLKRESCEKRAGGGSGIRTHDTVSRIHAFQASAFSHSATPPGTSGAI
jgi:hypothetical protein